MEIDVTSDRDILQWSERGAYLHWVVESDYITSGKCDVAQVFSAVIEVVVEHASKSPTSSSGCSQDLLMLLQSQVTNSSTTRHSIQHTHTHTHTHTRTHAHLIVIV